MINVTNLTMQYGSKLLFADVNFSLSLGNKYGLVGANGAGKSTLFKIISKEEDPSEGDVNIVKNAKIGCLRQDQFLFENNSIINTVIAGNEQLWKATSEKEQLLSLDQCDEQTGYRLGELEQIIFDNEGYIADIFAAELLVGLGIKEEYHHKPLSTLSGGYKLRVLLAQSLFNKPDILLLDEPTNHLDILSIDWLETYLKEQFRGVLLFISHDMMFLDNLATHILDIDYGEIRLYTGNYTKFVTEKKLLTEQKIHEVNYMEKKVARMQSFVDRFKALAARSRQAKSREKQIEKIELPDIQKSSRISPYFNFEQKRASGKVVLDIKQISKMYQQKSVLSKVNFTIQRGEKIVIIGPNGIGKSTLLKIITSNVQPDQGSFEWGYETQLSYFAQDHHELLDKNSSILDWLCEQQPTQTNNAIRSILGRVLFRQDEVNKNVLSLSGGEGARLLIAKIMLEQSNVLILDEPTNHLDIEAKEVLKKSMIDYQGTLLLVTHDRDFVMDVATRIIAITHRGITDFKGRYADYLAKFGKDYLDSQWVLSNNL
ncbi:MAG: ATP-binding cassette domain-containing protein [Rickettsiaceae bacterium]|nr:MAG: ATP-binding cassette domain-containing protein [Rickettsiaceae bacterium]